MNRRQLRNCAIILAIILLFTPCPSPAQPSPQSIYTDDIQLLGTLGNNLNIEMHLEGDSLVPFLTQAVHCKSIKGTYYYQSQLRPITLEGTYCPASQILTLSNHIAHSETEQFVGKWNPQTKTFTGNWTLVNSGKTLPFTLTAIENLRAKQDPKGLYQLASEQLSTPPSKELYISGYRIDSLSWSQGIGQVHGFEVNDNGQFAHLSPFRIEFEYTYSTSYAAVEYTYTFQLLPSPHGTYVLEFITDHSTEDAEEGESAETYGSSSYFIQIWQWQAGEWQEVTGQSLPSDFKTQFTISHQGYPDAHALNAGIRIRDKKIYWNGAQMEWRH
jgi:hypothetical protein